MKILVDLTSLCRRITGIERYTLELFKHVVRRDVVNNYSLLFRQFVHPDFEGTRAKLQISPFTSQVPTEMAWIPFRCKAESPDVVHFPFFGPSPWMNHPKTVMTVYDANLWLNTNLLSVKTKLYTKPLIHRGVAKSQRIYTISESSRLDLVEGLGISERNVVNIGVGVSETFLKEITPGSIDEVLGRNRISRPYVLAVGTLEPRKNLPAMIRAFATFVRESASKDLSLVLVGRKGWGGKEVAEVVSSAGMGHRIITTGFVSDEDLRHLYAGAECFALPSLYEGFGLPVLEALVSGTPVLCSAIEPLKSMFAGRVVLINPRDEHSIVEGLMEITGPGDWKARTRVGRAQVASQFSWGAVADRLIDDYSRFA